MKIAHISDLHLDKLYKRSNFLKTLRLIEFIADGGFDHLIITGDITENAEASAFELARNILKKHGFLNSRKTSLVIGNHDIYGGVHLAEDVINFPAKCRNTSFSKKVEEFGVYFAETLTGAIRTSLDNPFPFVKEFDDFILIGLNSIAEYSVLKNPIASNGRISGWQLEDVESVLKLRKFPNKRRIVITHHHFCKDPAEESHPSSLVQKIERQTMKLRGKKKLLKRFRKLDVSHVLHGHLHETNQYSRRGITFLNAGGSVLNGTHNEFRFNSINISGNEITNEVITAIIKDAKPAPGNHVSPFAGVRTYKEKEICLN
jgi:3',5'-cyclic AMP phosphodiesterase CpdA